MDPLRKDSELWVPGGNPTNQLREPRVAGRRRGRGRGAGLPFLRGAPAAGAAQLRAALRCRGTDHHHLGTLLLLLLLDIMSESEIEIESDRTPTNDDEIECEGESKQQHKRKTARRQGPVGQWDIICEKVSEEDINSRLQSTARVELGGSANWSGATWKPPVGWNKQGLRRRIYRCPFRGAANASCTAELRVTEDEQGKWTLERKRTVHANHAISNKTRGLSKAIICAATSPTKNGLPPARVIKNVREQFGALSDKDRTQCMRVLKYDKLKKRQAVVPHELRKTFGGFVHWAKSRTRDALMQKKEFGVHTVYVCGESEIDSTTQTVNMAYSTENLLLNAYRQEQHGISSIVQIDCTHRLMLEGHACMLFGTVDAAQHFHPVSTSTDSLSLSFSPLSSLF